MKMMWRSKLLAHCVWIVHVMKLLPVSFVERYAPPAVADLLAYQKVIDVLESSSESASSKEHRTIFHELKDNPDLPPEERSIERLQQEGQTLVAAGSETTAKTLSIILFHLCEQPELLRELRHELDSTPVGGSWEQLEKLPWLSAIVYEGLRLNFGITGRTQRVSPETAISYGEWTIPAGAPMSMMSYFAHMNEEIFPDAQRFEPRRWIGAEGQQRRRYLVSFGKGPRMCIAVHLATAELCLTLNTLLRRFDFELYHTELRDVRLEHDFIVIQSKLDSKGVRAYVRPRQLEE